MDSERDAVVLVPHGDVRAGAHRHEVRRQRPGCRESPLAGADLRRGAVAEDDPVLRRADREVVGCLEVRLVEAGVHARGGIEEEATGAWDALAEKVRAVENGTVIISHEILASASWQQAKHALDSLGDSEIHIMLSARDLARQIPAEWQENVKHRSVVSYAEFLDEMVRDWAIRFLSWSFCAARAARRASNKVFSEDSIV